MIPLGYILYGEFILHSQPIRLKINPSRKCRLLIYVQKYLFSFNHTNTYLATTYLSATILNSNHSYQRTLIQKNHIKVELFSNNLKLISFLKLISKCN